MRVLKVFSAAVAVVVLVSSASTTATAAPAAACGTTDGQWVGTYKGTVTGESGRSSRVRAVLRKSGGDLVADTYFKGELKSTGQPTRYEEGDLRWNSSGGPVIYSFGPTACSGGHVTKASVVRELYFPNLRFWKGTVNRKA